MSQMFLAASSANEQLFFAVTPIDDSNDGVVIRRKQVFYVPFWSYFLKNADTLNPITSSLMLKELWSDTRSDEWWPKFYDRTARFNDSELAAIEGDLQSIPARGLLPSGKELDV